MQYYAARTHVFKTCAGVFKDAVLRLQEGDDFVRNVWLVVLAKKLPHDTRCANSKVFTRKDSRDWTAYFCTSN